MSILVYSIVGDILGGICGVIIGYCIFKIIDVYFNHRQADFAKEDHEDLACSFDNMPLNQEHRRAGFYAELGLTPKEQSAIELTHEMKHNYGERNKRCITRYDNRFSK